MNRFSTTFASALLITAALTCTVLGGAACEGGKGEPDPEITPQPFGPRSSLVPLNDPAAEPKVADKTVVSLTGLRVVHVDTFDETGTGAVGDVFMQDATDEPGPYQGLLAFRAQTSPPSYRLLAGDVVDISGVFEQFKAPEAGDWPDRFIPEIGNGSVQFRFDPIGPPIARVIDTNDLFDADLGYQWRSMLVTLENVKIGNTSGMPSPQEGRKAGDPGPANKRAAFKISTPTPKNDFEVPSVNNELFDLAAFYYDNDLAAGRTIKRLTGVVKVFGMYNIAPRSAADIELE